MNGNDYTRHLFHELKALKGYTVYQLKYVENGTNQLTEALRIEDYRGYSMGKGFNQYLRLRTSSNWQRCEQVTGLKFTKNENIFFGDRVHNGKKNLLIFSFSNNRKTLIIDYFKGFYPANIEALKRLLNKHFTA